jgi:hypothetical protein
LYLNTAAKVACSPVYQQNFFISFTQVDGIEHENSCIDYRTSPLTLRVVVAPTLNMKQLNRLNNQSPSTTGNGHTLNMKQKDRKHDKSPETVDGGNALDSKQLYRLNN